MGFAAIKEKARDLFREADFIGHIKNEEEYGQALALMDELIEDYDNQRLLIEVLSVAIERWENTSQEFVAFNRRISDLDGGVSVLKVLMEQHGLGVADLPEIGSKSLVSKILNNERNLTRKHIESLSNRFGVSPALFFSLRR
ncbi:MAG: transcriptional regulator [Deltaproteobacteria bacterium RIFOXYD12_FULL_57_12]|nr:MAG: transcriptional regulator [Deltaproteobacteria bacterium RIFOXYD12_FULL_57_12]